jgi:hypothetical protein
MLYGVMGKRFHHLLVPLGIPSPAANHYIRGRRTEDPNEHSGGVEVVVNVVMIKRRSRIPRLATAMRAALLGAKQNALAPKESAATGRTAEC